MKLDQPGLRSRLRYGKAFFVAIAVAAVLTVGGFAAYKLLFGRPGEAAAMLLPADADIVITLDTNPSERQAATFKKIADALEREGIAKKLDEALADFLDGKPVGAEIRPQLSRSFATGIWLKDGEPADAVTLLAVKDADAVRKSLEKHGQSRSGGIFALDGPGEKLLATIVESYLAVSNTEVSLARIEEVRSGRQAAVGRLAEFVAARQTLPQDANVMVFLSPRVFEEIEKASGSTGVMKGTEWMAYGLTVEPDGLALDFHCPMDASKVKALRALAGTKPFRLETLKSLPAGAYGVLGYSQAGRYWDVISDSARETPEMREGFQHGLEEFESETGLDVEKDVVPAFEGEQVFAVYPGPSGEPMDLDGVLYLTDANGANPAQLAAKLRGLIERKTSEAGEAIRFIESKIGDVTVWEIDGKTRDMLTQSLGEELASPAAHDLEASAPWEGEGSAMRIEGHEQAPLVDTEPSRSAEPPKFLAEKTVICAQLGNGVLVTSSRALLNRAIADRASGRTLAEDPSFAGMWSHVVPDSQYVLMVDLKRVMDALRPVMEPGLEGAPFSVDDIVGVFGDSAAGLVASGKYDGKVGVGRLMLPLDFERLIHLIGKGMRTEEGPAGSPKHATEH